MSRRTPIEDLEGEGIQIPAEALDINKHNGIFTLRNPATGGYRTLKVYTVRGKNERFNGYRRIALVTAQDRYLDIAYQVNGVGRWMIFQAFRSVPGHKRTFHEILVDMLVNAKAWQDRKGAEYRVSGHCRRCNRRLTTPSSIDSGVGPECAKKT